MVGVVALVIKVTRPVDAILTLTVEIINVLLDEITLELFRMN